MVRPERKFTAGRNQRAVTSEACVAGSCGVTKGVTKAIRYTHTTTIKPNTAIRFFSNALAARLH
jgi:hypothetical protein